MRANPFARLKTLIFFILNYERDASDLRRAQWIILSEGNSVERKKNPHENQKENEDFYKTRPVKRTSYGNRLIRFQLK